MANENGAVSSLNIKYYIRILFIFCCVIWLIVALDHYRNDGFMFDYEYISSNMIRRLLSEQQTYQQWNDIVKNEFTATNLKEMDTQTSQKIIDMIQNDRMAINENSQKFHKILPLYILAKRQVNIQNALLAELIRKRNKEKRNFDAVRLAAQKEQKGMAMVTESGMKESESHNLLEHGLESEVSSLRKEFDQITHLIHSEQTLRDKWHKKAETEHEELLSIMELDKTDRSLEPILNRLVHYSSNTDCDWQRQQSLSCSFQTDIDVGIQFDAHYFTVHNPPNHINLKKIIVQRSNENTDNLCKIKVFIGVNEICDSKSFNHIGEDGNIEKEKPPLREICTANFLTESSNQNDGCGKCNGVNIDVHELQKSMLPNEKQSDALSSFCVVMKRFYPEDTGHNSQCKGKATVELAAATTLERGHISCLSAHQKRKNEKEKTLRRRKKNKHTDDTLSATEQENFAWRQMAGYWSYCATFVAGVIGVGSLYMVYL